MVTVSSSLIPTNGGSPLGKSGCPQLAGCGPTLSVEGPLGFTHSNASAQVFSEGLHRSRFVWITDLLPDEFATPTADLMERGIGVIKTTLESHTLHRSREGRSQRPDFNRANLVRCVTTATSARGAPVHRECGALAELSL